MKRFFIVCIIVGILFAWSGFPQKAFSAPEEIWLRIGAANPLSGPGAMWGLPSSRGVELMAEFINDQGGLKVKDRTYKFKVFLADNKYSAEGGKSAYEKLLSVDNCQIMVGDFAAAPVAIMSRLSTEKKIICLFGSTGSPTLSPNYPYVFRFSQSQTQKLDVLKVAKETCPIKSIYFAYTDDQRGHDVVREWSKVVLSMGMKIVGETYYHPRESNFAPVMTKILAEKPDLIPAGSPGQAALMMKEAHALGYKGYWVSSGSVVNLPEMIKIAGSKEAVENWIGPYESLECPVVKESDKPVLLEIQKRYLKKYSPPFEPLAWRYTCGMQILCEAIKQAGGIDPDALKKALETGTFETFFGSGKFTGQKTYGIAHQFAVTTIAVIIKNGEPKYLGYLKTQEP
jgi:branched-chain amino acid transport system substrate-binding protein